MIKYITISLIVFIAILSSCDIAENDVSPSHTFVKIYDDSRFEEEYYPVDIIQTADEGFLVLSEKKNDQSLFTSVFILKVDKNGEVENSLQLPAPSVLAVDGWSKIDDQYYFICMNENTLGAQLIAVDEAGTVADPVAINGVTYPLSTSISGDNILILSYDNQNTESVISVVSTQGSVTQQASYSIGAGVDVEKPIIDHLTRNGRQLPFSIGATGSNGVYFNGFYNYTFSLVFSNFGSSPTGVCQGQLSLGGISAVTNLGASSFGIARFNFSDNYLNPNANIPTNSITSSTDLGGNIFPEIEIQSKIEILQTENNKQIFGTNTRAKKLVLYGYNESGEALSTQYIGTDNPYSFAAFTTTVDGGIAILAQTALEGRFQRLALFKRNTDFVNTLLQQ